jgi:hypothetical protein
MELTCADGDNVMGSDGYQTVDIDCPGCAECDAESWTP